MLQSRQAICPRVVTLKREKLHRWEVVLFPPYFAVVLYGHLEQFEMSVRGRESAVFPQALHLGCTKGLKAHGDPEILIENLYAVDSADRGRGSSPNAGQQNCPRSRTCSARNRTQGIPFRRSTAEEGLRYAISLPVVKPPANATTRSIVILRT